MQCVACIAAQRHSGGLCLPIPRSSVHRRGALPSAQRCSTSDPRHELRRAGPHSPAVGASISANCARSLWAQAEQTTAPSLHRSAPPARAPPVRPDQAPSTPFDTSSRGSCSIQACSSFPAASIVLCALLRRVSLLAGRSTSHRAWTVRLRATSRITSLDYSARLPIQIVHG